MVRNLGKFELYKPFFAKFKGTGEPVRCDDEERRAWLNRLEQLKGTTPCEEFDTMVEFMIAWGKVREVLRYEGSVMLVRYEVGGMLYGSDEVTPKQLLARFVNDGLQAYTVMHERGVAEPFAAHLHVQSSRDKSMEGRTENRKRILEFAEKMKPDDFIVIEQKSGTYSMAQVMTCDLKPGVGFIVEWQCGSMMWQCGTTTRSRKEMKRFLAAYMDEGLPAAQMVFKKWHLIDWYGYAENYGRKVDIDRRLSAAGLQARRKGDEKLVKRLEKLGLALDFESVKANDFGVDLGKCPQEDVRKTLRRKAKGLPDLERKKVLLYLTKCCRVAAKNVAHGKGSE